MFLSFFFSSSSVLSYWIILLVEFQSALRWYINRIKSFKHFFMNHILVFRGNGLYIFAFILNTKTCNCNCLLISLISRKSYIITLWSLSGLLTIKMLLRSSFLESLHQFLSNSFISQAYAHLNFVLYLD